MLAQEFNVCQHVWVGFTGEGSIFASAMARAARQPKPKPLLRYDRDVPLLDADLNFSSEFELVLHELSIGQKLGPRPIIGPQSSDSSNLARQLRRDNEAE